MHFATLVAVNVSGKEVEAVTFQQVVNKKTFGELTFAI